jgi:hypothetical protein
MRRIIVTLSILAAVIAAGCGNAAGQTTGAPTATVAQTQTATVTATTTLTERSTITTTYLVTLPNVTTRTVTTVVTAPGDTVLTYGIMNHEGRLIYTYSMAQLKALSSFQGYCGAKNADGSITPPAAYRGVTLDYLLTLMGTNGPKVYSLKITAADGSFVILTYSQLTQDTFTFYNLNGEKTATPDGKTFILFAYEANGQPLDGGSGPVEMCIITGADRVTDSANFIKNVTEIELNES